MPIQRSNRTKIRVALAIVGVEFDDTEISSDLHYSAVWLLPPPPPPLKNPSWRTTNNDKSLDHFILKMPMPNKKNFLNIFKVHFSVKVGDGTGTGRLGEMSITETVYNNSFALDRIQIM